MVKSTLYLFGSGTLILSLAGLLLFSYFTLATGDTESLAAKRQLVSYLGLTDLSLCSEARYTRHPSQADLFSAFQDFPGSFEHFPTGSIIPPSPVGFYSRVQVLSQSRNE